MDFSAFFETDVPAAPAQNEVFMGQLSEEDWKRFLSLAERRLFRAGETLIRQGDSGRAFYLVASGRLEVIATDNDGQQHRVGFIEPLSIFGELAFFDGHPRSASVRTVSAGEVYGITPDSFELLSARHPDIARIALFDLGRILSLRLREMTQIAMRVRKL
jgi:SulP family sulfate permease